MACDCGIGCKNPFSVSPYWSEITPDQKPAIFFEKPCPAVTVGGSGGDAGPQWTDWCPGSQQKPPWSLVGRLMEDSCQSCSIHVYVFLQREVGVNSGHSDQLALAESGLLTSDSCWAVLPINLLGLSWSWCSVLSSSAAKHTATFTPQLQLSVSLGVSLQLTVTSSRFRRHLPFLWLYCTKLSFWVMS